MMVAHLLVGGGVLLAAAVWVSAADTMPGTAPATRPAATRPVGGAKKPLVAYLDPETAGVDYKIQGEYALNKDGSGLGGQVMALRDKAGNTTFHAVVFPGGLPGAGWDGRARIELNGKLNADKAELTDARGSKITADGVTLAGRLENPVAEIKLMKVARTSPTMGAQPPEGAFVIFDGKNTDNLNNAKMDERGLLGVSEPKGGPRTKKDFTDFALHVEFLVPFVPAGMGQERGNSGVYMQYRYEVQVLDSFGLVAKDDDCGGVYKNAAPTVNMCFPPLTWQTYDIDFTAARFADGKKVKNAQVTVKQNGVLIVENAEVKGPTGSGNMKEDATPGPIYFQDHFNPVYYRNIWVVEKKMP